MKKKSREIEIFSLSFLDIISCAFGAIILILLVIKKGDTRLEKSLDFNTVEKNIIDNLNYSQSIEKLRAENKLLKSVINTKSSNIEVISNQLEQKKKEIESNAIVNQKKKKV